MKDIYIRQLSAHAAGVAEQVQNEDSINELHAQIEQLQIQLQQANTISDQWRIEVDHSRQQYESYGRQLNQNILQLSAQVEKLIEEKLSAESRVEMLQQQLTTMQDERIANEKAIELCDDVNDDVEDATVKHARQQLIIMELKNELDTMRQMMVDNQSIQQQLIEKVSD
jgi:DNA repair exonuclease SbcCD ATPase subunit